MCGNTRRIPAPSENRGKMAYYCFYTKFYRLEFPQQLNMNKAGTPQIKKSEITSFSGLLGRKTPNRSLYKVSSALMLRERKKETDLLFLPSFLLSFLSSPFFINDKEDLRRRILISVRKRREDQEEKGSSKKGWWEKMARLKGFFPRRRLN